VGQTPPPGQDKEFNDICVLNGLANCSLFRDKSAPEIEQLLNGVKLFSIDPTIMLNFLKSVSDSMLVLKHKKKSFPNKPNGRVLCHPPSGVPLRLGYVPQFSRFDKDSKSREPL
jgi:hypothetical protein